MATEASRLDTTTLDALADGRHGNSFALLGPHVEAGQRMLRTLQPGATAVILLDRRGVVLQELRRVHPGGVFEGELPPRLRHYRLRVEQGGDSRDSEDPYRFPSLLGSLDLHLLGEGAHEDMYQRLGAHCTRVQGVAGTHFALWAPNASRVSLIGDFNRWDGRRHVMRLHPGNGIWDIFMPGVGQGAHYKFELLDRDGRLLPLKADPLGQFQERPPGNASVVCKSRHQWRDRDWMAQRSMFPRLDQPVSIYEVHLGSWRRDAQGEWLSYRDLARQLTDYVTDMGFTHVEFMPVTEHPFDGSWGYQPIGLFAPTWRFGDPDDFRYLVDHLHQAGIGVIADWVPAHFPRDEHGLARFDGSALYEHADPRLGEHSEWGTLIFNYGRREVINYLLASARYWVREMHIDALRVDAVASMLYLDYSREDGEWLPNIHGGNQNLEAVAFLQRLNAMLHREGATSYAEESTAWAGVSRPVEAGGLGFTYKWNMGWMNDTLRYMGEDTVHRKHHHDQLTFGLVYAFTENFVLPLSHDEVVHGKGSLLGRMPGDEWQRFANLRAYLGYMYGHPGKKLLFMGAELAQYAEWSHDRSLDWHLLDYPLHRGVQGLVRELNRVYCATPALYQRDFDGSGFEWIEHGDRDAGVLAWLRRAADGSVVVCVSHFTPVTRHGFRLGMPGPGRWRVLLDTDQAAWGGSGALQAEALEAQPLPWHGREHSLVLTLPPLASLVLIRERG
jgi:1,4-alpha-glucan branching enzyme